MLFNGPMFEFLWNKTASYLEYGILHDKKYYPTDFK